MVAPAAHLIHWSVVAEKAMVRIQFPSNKFSRVIRLSAKRFSVREVALTVLSVLGLTFTPLKLPLLKIPFLLNLVYVMYEMDAFFWDWGYGSTVGTHAALAGTRTRLLLSQQPYGSSQPYVTSVPGDRCPPLVFVGTGYVCIWYTDIHLDKTQIYIKSLDMCSFC